MKESFDFWEKVAESVAEKSATRFDANKDITSYDVNFILNYCDLNSKVLDVGSGTGIIINQIYKYVDSITAIEPFKNFSQHIINSENVKIINLKAEDFIPAIDEYDLATCFGMIQYLDEEESLNVYKKSYSALKQGGRIIVKHQFGIKEKVDVFGFSEELQRNYRSQYRHIDKEVKMLESIGYTNIQTFDIYPPECNRWDNTHFYAIVAEK